MSAVWLAKSFLMCLFVAETEQCKDGVCLTWSVTLEQLKLVCKVGKLGHRIYIRDPAGATQAYCVPPNPKEQCESYSSNSHAWQNVRTNQTFYTVRGRIDDHLNGNWTCTHGTGLGTANVDVTVLKITEHRNVTKVLIVTDNYKCLKQTLLISMGSFIMTLILYLIIRYGIFIGSKYTTFCGWVNGSRCADAVLFRVTGLKAVCFLVVTVVYVTLMILSSTVWKTEYCNLKWFFGALSFVFGCCFCLIFLIGPDLTPNRQDKNGNSGQGASEMEDFL